MNHEGHEDHEEERRAFCGLAGLVSSPFALSSTRSGRVEGL